MNGKPIGEEVVYSITSLRAEIADEARILDLVPGQWSIDNGLHHVRDTTYDEDRSQIRKGNGPRTMATLRNLAISLINLHGFKSVAQATVNCKRIRHGIPA